MVSPYYDVAQKRRNLGRLSQLDAFENIEADLLEIDVGTLLDGVDVVFHQAGQPGVRASWDEFGSYLDNNVAVTQRLLDGSATAGVQRFVFASSSSIYGDAQSYPTPETAIPKPHSPYGVTKLAAEHLVGVYARNWGLPTVALRYFTVYGPRQRPDMAMHRLIEAALQGTTFPVFGDGSQVRDFTYVGDVVEANLAAATHPIDPGTVINVAGGDSTTLAEVIAIVERLAGREIAVDRLPAQRGDVRRTGGATEVAKAVLDWSPTVTVADGLAKQLDWHRHRTN